MPVNRTKLYLSQALDAIDKIQNSTSGLGKDTYEDYEIRWVVERGLLIVGEALNRIKSLSTDIPASVFQKVISTRNKLAHEYDVIDHELLYAIVTKHLPVLRQELLILLKKED